MSVATRTFEPGFDVRIASAAPAWRLSRRRWHARDGVGTRQVRLRQVHQRYTYVARWRCVDGTWYLASEIFSG